MRNTRIYQLKKQEDNYLLITEWKSMSKSMEFFGGYDPEYYKGLYKSFETSEEYKGYLWVPQPEFDEMDNIIENDDTLRMAKPAVKIDKSDWVDVEMEINGVKTTVKVEHNFSDVIYKGSTYRMCEGNWGRTGCGIYKKKADEFNKDYQKNRKSSKGWHTTYSKMCLECEGI